MADTFNVSEIDFDTLKTSAKEFLGRQSRFQDYNFDGSGMSVILDLMTYFTHTNAFYANMAANESFLHSAVLRNSVVAKARELGYLPQSKISARAYIDVDITAGTDPPNTIIIPQNTKFASSVDDISLNFFTVTDTLCALTDGHFLAEDVQLSEGYFYTASWTVDLSDPFQKFIIPSGNVDVTQVAVRIKESGASQVEVPWHLATDVNTVDGDSEVFFIQEIDEGKHQVYFGNGIVGKALVTGNIVLVDYVVSKGSTGNFASTFRLSGNIEGYNGTSVTVTTAEAAADGSDEEEVDSIKRLAPRSYQAQNRAVTKYDYETLLIQDFPYLEAVKVWGGEEANPPVYGRVYVAAKPRNGLNLSTRQKASLAKVIESSRSILSTVVDIVDTDYLRLVVSSRVKYNGKITTKTDATMESVVRAAIQAFADTNLGNYDSELFYSPFCTAIYDTDAAIVDNLTHIGLKYRFEPTFNIPTRYVINFSNELDSTAPRVLTSTSFIFAGQAGILQDDGAGVVSIYRADNSRRVLLASAGSIDYNTGELILFNFAPSSISGGGTAVDISVVPASYDVTPSFNQILLLEDEDVTITMVDTSLT